MATANRITDQLLGMNADITRRDFLNGAAIAVGASILPSPAAGAGVGAQDLPGYYPPALDGLRGSHPGAFEAAHQARDGKRWIGERTGEAFDLVVVGAGISGLAAAYFYRRDVKPNARILILDNHDDFGGHAKRNEYELDGKTIIGYGGTMLMEAPGAYPKNAKRLIDELGIEPHKFQQYFNTKLYSSLGLTQGLFFDKKTFGTDHLAVGDLTHSKVLAKSPISKKARADLKRLFENSDHYLHDIPKGQQTELLKGIDYQSYLRDFAKLDDEALQVVLSSPRGVWAVNTDAFPAYDAWYFGYPGFGDLTLGNDDGETTEREAYRFHYPDGNATIARSLVQRLNPEVCDTADIEEIVTAPFDYTQLDSEKASARIRLNSTVARVQHVDNELSGPIDVTYVRDDKAYIVEAQKVILACYNAIIPNLCPEMPAEQKSALRNCVRAPLVYTNVLIRNWRSFKNLGIHRVNCPGSFHSGVTLDYPVSIGDYEFAKSPDDPIVLHCTQVPGEPGNPSAKGQFNAGKRQLLATSFETFERKIREQLNALLGPGGFDAARDIAGITVNRWPHGYAYSHDPETDQIAFNPDSWPVEKRSWKVSSQPFGKISIASTDSASNAMTESAIEEAYRAVKESI